MNESSFEVGSVEVENREEQAWAFLPAWELRELCWLVNSLCAVQPHLLDKTNLPSLT